MPARIRRETAPELTNSRQLLLTQIIKRIINLLQITYIHKKLLRISQPLIHIIKIIQQHITPKHKLIKALRRRIHPLIDPVKHKKQTHLIRHLQIRLTRKKLVDGKNSRRKQRPFRHQRQLTLKENPCPSVGKYKRHARNPRPVCIEK
ncbi:MAG: hypothetical protein ACRDD0_01880 [Bacteroidales bacterium]